MSNISVAIQDVVLMKLQGVVQTEVSVTSPVQVNITDTVVTQTAITGQVPVCTQIPFDVSNSFAQALTVKTAQDKLGVEVDKFNDLIQAILTAARTEVSFDASAPLTVETHQSGVTRTSIEGSVSVSLSDIEGGLLIKATEALPTTCVIQALPTVTANITSAQPLDINVWGEVEVRRNYENEAIFYCLLETVGGIKKSFTEYFSEQKSLEDLYAWMEQTKCEFEALKGEEANILDFRISLK